MSLYVAVKDPAAFGLWHPGRRHRAPDRHPLRDRHPAFFRAVDVVASAVTCAVYTEVEAVHVHGMRSVGRIDPAPVNFLSYMVCQPFVIRPTLAIDHEHDPAERVSDRMRRRPLTDYEHTIIH